MKYAMRRLNGSMYTAHGQRTCIWPWKTRCAFVYCGEHGVRLAQKRFTLAHAFLWDYSYNRLKLAKFWEDLGAILTCVQLPLLPPPAPISP
jgi:hypothetical protein